MQVRIYRPAKTAMQSGPAGNAKQWVLEYEPTSPKKADRLMGWLGSPDTAQQVRLKFATQEDAVAFARRKGMDAQVTPEPQKAFRPKNYAENFSFAKLEFGRF
jgi:ETC complex I subunit conserved region